MAVAGERGVAVGGDVVGSVIVTGDDVSVTLQVGPESGALLEQLALLQRPKLVERRPPPPPRPVHDRLDRVEETADVLAAAPRGPVNVHGEAGIGKTYVLRDVAAGAAGDRAKDGVAYLFARGRSRDDLLQDVFDSFWEATPPTKPSTPQILRAVAGRKAFLLLDSLELERDEVQAIASTLPSGAVVAASRQRVLWEGHALPLGGLALADGVALVERELGRPLAPDERPGVEWLWRSLEGHPLRLRQAAAVAKERGETLAPPTPGAAAATGGEPIAEALRLLDGDERTLLAALVVLGETEIGSERLGRLVGRGDPTASLDRLRQLGLIEAQAGRYAASAAVVAHAGPLSELLPAAGQRLVDSLLAWLRERPPLADVARELPALAAAVGIAQRSGRLAEAVELGRAIDPALALSGHWDAWGNVLETALASARGLGDRAGAAWALHELGTRAASLGHRTEAAAALGEALELRRELGDEAGARLTAHNLEVGLGRAGLLTRIWNRRLYTASVPAVLAGIAVVALLLLGGGVAAALALSDGGGTTATLAVGFDGDGSGSVTITPPGMTCTGDCDVDVDTGTDVTLRAAPAPGSTFEGWVGCPDPDGATCNLTLTGDLAVTARFVTSAPEFELRVNTTGGRVESDDGGIVCPSDCDHSYPPGTPVALTAEADAGFAFDRWDGCDAESGDAGEVCEVTLDSSREVTAVFSSAPATALTVTVDPADGGTVTGDGGAISCSTTCSYPYPAGTTVTLTATRTDFDRWEGCDAETGEDGEVCDVRLDESRAVTAFFAVEPADETLTVTVVGEGAAEDKAGGRVTSDDGTIDCTTTCSHDFPANTRVTLTAMPNSPSVFVGWRGCTEPNEEECTVTVDASRDVTAVFRYPRLDVEVSGGTLTSTPAGIDCPDACTAGFARGTVVTLTAEPSDASGEFTFVTWEGACAGTEEGDTTCTVTVDDNTSASADITISG